jgi:plasmid replication initiation protein
MDKKEKELELLKSKSLVQHNAITTARYEMTTYEKNIIYMLLAQINKNDPTDLIYYIDIKDIETLTNKEISYEDLHKSTLKLRNRGYTIIEKEGNMLQVSIISSARYIKGSGKIAIRMDPEVRPYLFDLKANFTQFGLHTAMLLQSKYSKRLYEMLNQFKRTGIMRVTVDELKYRLGVKDPISGKDKYFSWTMFSSKVLDPAKNEINGHTDIFFKCEAIKQGRKFTDLVFKITHERQIQKDQKEQEILEVKAAYNRLVDRYKLSKWQAEIILKHVIVKDINKILYEIQLKAHNGEIKNIGGFTAQTFENKYQLGLMKRTNTTDILGLNKKSYSNMEGKLAEEWHAHLHNELLGHQPQGTIQKNGMDAYVRNEPLGHQPQKLIQKNEKVLIELYGLSKWQAEVILKHVSIEDICKILYRIDGLKLNEEVNKIGDITAEIFKNEFQLEFETN